MSVDNSAEESSDNTKEKKRKKGKLSVLFNAAKHWQKTHDLKKPKCMTSMRSQVMIMSSHLMKILSVIPSIPKY